MINLDGDTGVAGFRGGVIDGSDKRMKNTISDLDKKRSSEFIYSLSAKSYRYNFEKGWISSWLYSTGCFEKSGKRVEYLSKNVFQTAMGKKVLRTENIRN